MLFGVSLILNIAVDSNRSANLMQYNYIGTKENVAILI